MTRHCRSMTSGSSRMAANDETASGLGFGFCRRSLQAALRGRIGRANKGVHDLLACILPEHRYRIGVQPATNPHRDG